MILQEKRDSWKPDSYKRWCTGATVATISAKAALTFDVSTCCWTVPTGNVRLGLSIARCDNESSRFCCTALLPLRFHAHKAHSAVQVLPYVECSLNLQSNRPASMHWSGMHSLLVPSVLQIRGQPINCLANRSASVLMQAPSQQPRCLWFKPVLHNVDVTTVPADAHSRRASSPEALRSSFPPDSRNGCVASLPTQSTLATRRKL
jgi:hypothetical protein